MFGIMESEFFFYLGADGFFGLGNGKGFGGEDFRSFNTLDQMVAHNIIDKK